LPTAPSIESSPSMCACRAGGGTGGGGGQGGPLIGDKGPGFGAQGPGGRGSTGAHCSGFGGTKGTGSLGRTQLSARDGPRPARNYRTGGPFDSRAFLRVTEKNASPRRVCARIEGIAARRGGPGTGTRVIQEPPLARFRSFSMYWGGPEEKAAGSTSYKARKDSEPARRHGGRGQLDNKNHFGRANGLTRTQKGDGSLHLDLRALDPKPGTKQGVGRKGIVPTRRIRPRPGKLDSIGTRTP